MNNLITVIHPNKIISAKLITKLDYSLNAKFNYYTHIDSTSNKFSVLFNNYVVIEFSLAYRMYDKRFIFYKMKENIKGLKFFFIKKGEINNILKNISFQNNKCIPVYGESEIELNKLAAEIFYRIDKD